MKVIVTVKLRRNPNHNPSNKKTGMCPLDNGKICTDITGSHHSYVTEGESTMQIRKDAEKRYGHVTRIEELDLTC